MTWHGKQAPGARRARREQRRAEAEARNTATPESKRRRVRLAADLLERSIVDHGEPS